MTIKSLIAGIVLGAVLAAAPMFAHHSFEAQYDRNKPITLTGPVSKLDWINPHARIFMDVKDTAGKVVKWEIELGAPAMLMRNGWSRTSIMIGESVTVVGSLAKDGSNMANARTVTLANGTRVFAGSSGGDGARELGYSQPAEGRSLTAQNLPKARKSLGTILKSDESCISNPKSEISNWTGGDALFR